MFAPTPYHSTTATFVSGGMFPVLETDCGADIIIRKASMAVPFPPRRGSIISYGVYSYENSRTDAASSSSTSSWPLSTRQKP
jgi:hypothetical protein